MRSWKPVSSIAKFLPSKASISRPRACSCMVCSWTPAAAGSSIDGPLTCSESSSSPASSALTSSHTAWTVNTTSRVNTRHSSSAAPLARRPTTRIAGRSSRRSHSADSIAATRSSPASLACQAVAQAGSRVSGAPAGR